MGRANCSTGIMQDEVGGLDDHTLSFTIDYDGQHPFVKTL